MKLQAIIAWLSQQSTQKAILALLTAAGIQFDVVAIEQAIAAFLALYGVIAGVRDKT
jgi:hypothetical protein